LVSPDEWRRGGLEVRRFSDQSRRFCGLPKASITVTTAVSPPFITARNL